MKTNRSNSFRLHRITKTHSLKKTHDSQYVNADDLPFKLQAINSINKGVKYNDLSFITGRDLNKLRKQPSTQNDMAHEAAHLNMTDMRRKYDETKQKRIYMDNVILRLKEQKERYELKQDTFDGGKNTGRGKVQNFQAALNQKSSLLQISEAQKKVLLGIRARHKADKVFYDQRKFDLEQEYSHLKKQLKIFQREGVQFGQNTDRGGKVYEKLLKQLDAEKNQREEHLLNMQALMDTKAQLVHANQIRGMQIHQIAQRAMLDKNLGQKQWQKILLTHVFLNKILRNKIEREMEKFKVVQFAFKQIKTATGVNDSRTLINKYLNKQQVYGELLGKISENERNIQILRGQTEKLLIQEKSLQAQRQILQNTKVVHQDLHDDLKDLQFYQQKSLSTQLYSNKFMGWLQRQTKKFDLVQKKSEMSKQKTNNVSSFKNYAQKLMNSLSKANQVKIDESSVENLSLQSDKLVRIQPKRARKNSIGEQIYDIDEEQTNATGLAEQTDVIASQRQEVLRNNQKFMKELKRKRQEMKNTLIEIIEKQRRDKDKPKLPEVKKQE